MRDGRLIMRGPPPAEAVSVPSHLATDVPGRGPPEARGAGAALPPTRTTGSGHASLREKVTGGCGKRAWMSRKNSYAYVSTNDTELMSGFIGCISRRSRPEPLGVVVDVIKRLNSNAFFLLAVE